MPTSPRPNYRQSPKEIPCPHCGFASGSRVVDSRTQRKDVKRRRKCAQCQQLFTTFERVDGAEMVLPSLDAMTPEQKKEILRVAAAIISTASVAA